MKYLNGTLGLLISIVILGTGMDAFGFLGFGGDSWKEEVLLHDGSKIVVKRSQTYGGRHEIGQPLPIKEHTIIFTMPDSNETITWTSEYSEELGRTNFDLLAVHILNNTPYIVAYPNLCLSYNKWGRPNPPYVFFKYDGATWQRIPLQEFPKEFTTCNVALITRGRGVEELKEMGLVPAEEIKKRNARSVSLERKTILREPLAKKMACGEMIFDGNGGWIGIGFFKKQSSYEACLDVCRRNNMSPEYCPCDRLFKTEGRK